MKLFRFETKQGPQAMATEPVKSLLMKMATPSIVAMLMQALYNTVDSMYVSQINAGSLAAVTLAFPVQMIMGALSTGIGVGINSSISRHLGSNQRAKASQAASNGLMLGFTAMVIMILFGIFGAEWFVSLYTKDPTVANGAVIYIRTICFLSVGNIFSQLNFSVLQGSGNMTFPMLSQIAGGLFVIFLDPIFIFTLGLGVRGAAIASSLAQIISMGIGFYGIFVKNKDALPVSLEGFRPNYEIIKDILYVGIPSALTQATTSIVAGIVNKQIAIYGKEAIAVYGAFSKLNSFVTLPLFGITRGMNPILGFCCGQRNKERFKETEVLAVQMAEIWTIFCFFVFMAVPHLLLKMMNANAKMMELGVPSFRILSASMLIIGASIVMVQVFPPVKRSYITMYSALLRQVILLVPLSIFLSKRMGIAGVWWAVCLADYLNFGFVAFMNGLLYKLEINRWKLREGGDAE